MRRDFDSDSKADMYCLLHSEALEYIYATDSPPNYMAVVNLDTAFNRHSGPHAMKVVLREEKPAGILSSTLGHHIRLPGTIQSTS